MTTAALLFLLGVFCGALFDTVWRWALELRDISKERDK